MKGWLSSVATLKRVVDLIRVRKFDVTFIHREAFPFGPPIIEGMLARLGRPLILDFDDALYVPYPYPSDTTTPVLYRLKRTGRQFTHLVKISHHVIAGNRILADWARKHNPNITVIPTPVDTQYYTVKDYEHRVYEHVIIGWMGSHSTIPELMSVQNIFQRLVDRFGDKIEFLIVGDTRFRPVVPSMKVIPFQLETEIRDLHAFDIGIMPLNDNEWTRGKCAYKALVYMAVGIPVVCSPVGVVNDFILHGQNGFLAPNEEQWVEILSMLIEDPELRRRVGIAGRQTVEEQFSAELWAPIFAEVITRVANARSSA